MTLTDWEISYKYAKTMRTDLGTLQDYIYDKMLHQQEYRLIKSHYSELVQLFNDDPRQRMVVTMCDCAKGHHFSVQLEHACAFFPYATEEDRAKLLSKMDYRNGEDYYNALLTFVSLGLFAENALLAITNTIITQNMNIYRTESQHKEPKAAIQSWVIACISNPVIYPKVKHLFCDGNNFILDFKTMKALNLPKEKWDEIITWPVHQQGHFENVKLWEIERTKAWDVDTFYRLKSLEKRPNIPNIEWHPYAHEYHVLCNILGRDCSKEVVQQWMEKNLIQPSCESDVSIII